MAEALGALLFLGWLTTIAYVFYKAGQRDANPGCCYRHWGRDDVPRSPPPDFPGLRIEQSSSRKPRTSNPGPEVIFVSRAATKGGDST